MATKIRTKITAEQVAAQHTISTTPIYQYRSLFAFGRSLNKQMFELTQSIKPTINIKLDANGKATVSSTALGVQYEHYSTWMHFDLKDLLWQIQTNYNPTDNIGYDEEYYYALYDFKLVFKHLETNNKTSWEFDGIDFQIPKDITSVPGEYEIALVIQEHLKDEEEGNVPDIDLDTRETFISYSWKGKVTASFFTPDLLDGIEVINVDTHQLSALIKPAIDCSLADDGFFMLNPNVSNNIGMYNDNFIRYFRFNPGQLTAHLQEFNLYLIFKQNEKIYLSFFEKTSEWDEKDDTTCPLISWVPTEVYNTAGDWRIMVAAVSQDYVTDDPRAEDYTENFYRFLSEAITVKVEPGFIEDLILVTNADEQYYTSNFITADEQVLIGDDNAILGGDE